MSPSKVLCSINSYIFVWSLYKYILSILEGLRHLRMPSSKRKSVGGFTSMLSMPAVGTLSISAFFSVRCLILYLYSSAFFSSSSFFSDCLFLRYCSSWLIWILSFITWDKCSLMSLNLTPPAFLKFIYFLASFILIWNSQMSLKFYLASSFFISSWHWFL